MFYTGRPGGEEATRIGLTNVCMPLDQVRTEAVKLATEAAECAPLGVIATRKIMRGNLADRVKAAANHEQQEENLLRATDDFQEGVKASSSAASRIRRAVERTLGDSGMSEHLTGACQLGSTAAILESRQHFAALLALGTQALPR
jgi:hypothetical protein